MNAKDELMIALFETGSQILCAEVRCNDSLYRIQVDHIEENLSAFLKSLDFEYDSGYGVLELCGTVWLKDGTWMDRGEYDGSEWWEHHKLPEIPKGLK